MRRTMRLLLTILVTAGTLGVVLPGTAQAVPVLKIKCIGDQVRRCLEVHVDSPNDRFRVWGRIIDAVGGGDYNVDVVQVGLLKDPDFSGTVDTAPHWFVACEFLSYYPSEYTVYATFRWRNVNDSTPIEGRLGITVTRTGPGCQLS